MKTPLKQLIKICRTHVLHILFAISIIVNLVLFLIILNAPKPKEGKQRKLSYSMNEVGCVGIEDSLINQVVEFGNKDAYHSMLICYLDKPTGEFLPYEFIMANKWNDPYAYYDVYETFLFLYDCSFDRNIEVMDSLSRNIALKYLLLAHDKATDSTLNALTDEDIRFYLDKKVYIKESGDSYILL